MAADARGMRYTRRFLTASIVTAVVIGLAPALGAVQAQNSPDGYHIVRSGDTVQSIARRYGVKADQIRRANGIVDDKLYAGARLRLTPAPGQRSSSGSAPSSSAGTVSGTYRIRKGDALERIARHHGVSLSALLSANGLTRTSIIHPGQTLTIPGAGSGASGSSSGSGSSVVPRVVCPVPGGRFMNDWGFPRGSGRYHQGTDVFAAKGTTIVAPISGTIRFGNNRLGGRTFTITSPSGWVAYGAHLASTTGSSGTVRAGTPIGTVGDSGNAKGGDPHLHLGLRMGSGAWVNPYPSLNAAC